MKQKLLKLSVLMVAILLFGTLSVNAAQELLGQFNNYNIESGTSSIMNGRAAHYDTGRASLYVDTVSSGTKKTAFRCFKLYGTKYEQKTYTTYDLSLGNMTVNLGVIGSGTWQLRNEAFDDNGNAYAGWGGTLSYYSIS